MQNGTDACGKISELSVCINKDANDLMYEIQMNAGFVGIDSVLVWLRMH